MNRFDEILKKSFHKKIPISVLFEITYRCNFNCSHCFYKFSRKEKELKKEKIFEILNALKKSGTLFITYSGGEPFLRKDFLEILNKTVEMGFVVSIFTNGSLINEKIVEKIDESVNLEISIYPEKISMYNPKKVLRNIKLLLQKNFKIMIKFILFKNYMDFYINLLELLKKENFENISIDYVIYPSMKDNKSYKYLIPEEKELKKIFSRFPHLYEKFIGEISIDPEQNICSAGSRFLSIDPYGNVNPCPFLKLNCGNLMEKTFSDIWHNSPNLLEIRNLKLKDWKKCLSCEYNKICRKCPAISYIDSGKINQPSEINCFFTKLISDIDIT